ncbi:MAG: alpha/beta hydrolase family protein [Vulcanimicrobiota bacterium]
MGKKLLLVLLLTVTALAQPVRRLELTELRDPERDDRLVQTRITYPDGQGPFPLVIVSHGNGGNWGSHQQIVDAIAAEGYVVLAPNHPASDTRRVFRHDKTYATGPDPGRDPAAVFGRPRDVSFLIDRAEQWNAERGHPLYGKLDLDHIAALGHSYGSYTVQAVCGAVPILDNLKPAVPPGKGPAPSLRDSRVDVGVVYSPSGPGSNFFDEGSYSGLVCPMLCLTGENDTQLSGGLKSARDRYRAYQLMPPGDKYHLWLAKAGHNGWDDLGEASRWARNAWRKATPEAADVVRISTAVTLAFLDLYLKGDQTARERLTQAYVNGLTGKVVTRVQLESK